MVYEDIYIKPRETLAQLAGDYGYNFWEWRKIWEEPKNRLLVSTRKRPERLLAGDKLIIPINWKISSKPMSLNGGVAGKWQIKVKRNGSQGKNIQWLQTVFADNQPKFPPSPYSVDLPTDDDEPFYWTAVEETADPKLRKEFYDAPFRNPPATRTTKWRAVLSLGVVTGKRVSIFQSIVWGVDFRTDGRNVAYSPRAATGLEITGHIKLLNEGSGKTMTFKHGGWTFRKAPII